MELPIAGVSFTISSDKESQLEIEVLRVTMGKASSPTIEPRTGCSKGKLPKLSFKTVRRALAAASRRLSLPDAQERWDAIYFSRRSQ